MAQFDFSDVIGSQQQAPPPKFDFADVIPGGNGESARITVRPQTNRPQTNSIGQGAPAPQGFLANATAPITGLKPTYDDIIRGALTAMSEGVGKVGEGARGLYEQGFAPEKPSDVSLPAIPGKPAVPISERLKNIGTILGGIGKTAAGAVEYTISPALAPFRSIVSQPVENVTGIPKEQTEFAASLFAPIPKRIPGLPAAPPSFVPPNPAGVTAEITNAALKTASQELRQKPEVTGTVLNNPARLRLADEIRNDFAVERVSDEAAQRVLGRVTAFEKRGGMASVDDIDALRKQIGEIQPVKDVTGGVTNAPELRAAEIARKRIDEFLPSATKEETITGNPAAAQATLAEARGNEAARFRSEAIDRKQFKAELRALARDASNVGPPMRQRIADILLDPAQLRGFSQQEIALMNRIVEGGGKFQKGARAVERFSREEKFISPVTRPVVAYPLAKLGEYLTSRDLDRLNAAIRGNSPLGRQLRTPLEDWGRANEAFQAAPTAQSFARFTLAARNLSNNLLDAGIKLAPDRLIRFESMAPARPEDNQQ